MYVAVAARKAGVLNSRQGRKPESDPHESAGTVRKDDAGDVRGNRLVGFPAKGENDLNRSSARSTAPYLPRRSGIVSAFLLILVTKSSIFAILLAESRPENGGAGLARSCSCCCAIESCCLSSFSTR